jgi:hypothetical protein
MKPAKIPRAKGNNFFSPYFPALDMDIMLLGIGIKAVSKINEDNATKFIGNIRL